MSILVQSFSFVSRRCVSLLVLFVVCFLISQSWLVSTSVSNSYPFEPARSSEICSDIPAVNRPDMLANPSIEEFSIAVSSTQIPKIIHQSWKTSKPPKVQISKTNIKLLITILIRKKFSNWAQTWKTLNPTYKYKLWTDDANRAFVANYYPWYLTTYDNLPKSINRVDAVRYLYMYQFGGVYADLDVEAIKPFDDLVDVLRAALESKDVVQDSKDSSDPPVGMIRLQNALSKGLTNKGRINEPSLLLPLMGTSYGFEHNIPNAWMASKPGHPFWMFVLVVIEEKLNEWKESVKLNREAGNCDLVDSGVEGFTGPSMLFEAVKRYNKMPISEIEKIYFLEPGVVFPFNWNSASEKMFDICSAARKNFDEDKCKEIYNATGKPDQKAWSITYWSHSWEGKKNMVIEKEKGEMVPDPSLWPDLFPN
ncbi:hypothetical protein HK096_006564 [Nowakowskiella sp. JEL0078]|nr:hypothetical protein HK096_006564 [Nowakowskiella sp. JEL0078]